MVRSFMAGFKVGWREARLGEKGKAAAFLLGAGAAWLAYVVIAAA